VLWWRIRFKKRNLVKPDELLARILDVAARVKKDENQLRWKTQSFQPQVTKCVKLDGGIFEHLFWVVKNYVIYVQKSCYLNIIIPIYFYTIHNAVVFLDSNRSLFLVTHSE